MLDGGTIRVGITVDDEQAQLSLKNLKDNVKNTSTSIDKYSAGIEKIGKVAGRVGLASVGAITKIGKSALDAYANYEQLVGGVDKLFGKSSSTVIKNANKAYQTAGVSANKYIEQATSFSASLISSLNGDTQKAAKITDMAIRDMSDNVNVFGSNMDDVQRAYQGFSKQNYTMLDNLKLGYGGTKTEMERLLKDAEKISGVKYDINNLSDVYEAIHVIQEEMGITGTTAKEAADTIQGSVNTMKSAWENWLTAIGSGSEKDIQKTTKALTKSIGNVGKNALPVIKNVLTSMKGLVAFASTAFGVKLVSKMILATNNLKKFKAATEGASAISGVFSGKLKASDAILGSTGSKVGKLASNFKFLGLQGAAAAGVLGTLVGALALTAYGISEAYKSTHKHRLETEEMIKSNQRSIDNVAAVAREAENYADKLTALNDKQDKTSQDIDLMAEYVKKLNELYPDLNLKIDKHTGKITKDGEEIKDLNKYLEKNIELLREQAEAEVHKKNYKKAIEKKVEDESKMPDVKQNYDEAKEAYNQAKQSGYVSPQVSQELQRAKAEYHDLARAIIEDTKEVNKQEINIKGWKNITKEAKEAGIKMSDSLKESIKSGQMKLPTKPSDWKKALKLQSMVDEVKRSGKKIPESVSEAMANGDYDKGIDKMERSLKKSTDKTSKSVEKAASKSIKGSFEKNIKAIQKKANKNPVKFKGDTKDINKKVAQTNSKKLNDKTSKLKGNLKDAIDKIKTVNSKRLNSKTSKLNAKDLASKVINKINNKRLKDKTLNIKGVLTGLSAKVKKALGLRRGTREIPYDGYQAELHKGERVLTATENNQYERMMAGFSSIGTNDKQIVELINALKNNSITVITQVDGRTLAQTTAPYMSDEIDKINYRTNRKLGYV